MIFTYLAKVIKLFEFEAAVRGYHYYKKYRVLVENQELHWAHDVDYFAIKNCWSASGKIVEHLPMVISHPSNFLLQRRAVIKAALSSNTYRKSPLVQGGLEKPCQVSGSIPETLKKRQITKKFEDMVSVLEYWVHFFTTRLRFAKIQENEPLILSLRPILIDKRRKRKKRT